MTYYNQVIERLTGIRDNTSGVSSLANQSAILDELGLPDIDDLDFYIHTQATRMYDNFNNDTLNVAEWGTKVENSSTSINATNGYLKFSNAGTGTGGESYVPLKKKFGKGLSIEADIVAWDGGEPADGERCKGYIELYKNSSYYVRFGLYRDASETINSKVYVWYLAEGQGNESLIDADNTSFGAIERNYRIDVTNNNLNFYCENQLVADLNYSHLNTYNVRLGAATQNAADVIDVRFDDFKINAYGEIYRNIVSRLTALQGGSESIQTVYNTVDSILDFDDSGEADEILTDGTEQNLYNCTDNRPFVFEGGSINFSNVSSNTLMRVKVYKMISSGGSFYQSDCDNYTGAPSSPLVTISSHPSQYGTRVTIQQMNDSNISVPSQWFDSR